MSSWPIPICFLCKLIWRGKRKKKLTKNYNQPERKSSSPFSMVGILRQFKLRGKHYRHREPMRATERTGRLSNSPTLILTDVMYFQWKTIKFSYFNFNWCDVFSFRVSGGNISAFWAVIAVNLNLFFQKVTK